MSAALNLRALQRELDALEQVQTAADLSATTATDDGASYQSLAATVGFFILTQGGPNQGTTTLGIWSFTKAFSSNSFGQGAKEDEAHGQDGELPDAVQSRVVSVLVSASGTPLTSP